MKLTDQRVTVVGLGLMGGSLALALRDQVAALDGVDPDPHALSWVRQHRLLDRASEQLTHSLRESSIVVLAAPVRANIRLLGSLSQWLDDGTLVIDLSSTKAEIIEAMDRLRPGIRAIGGHPMCGKEHGGIEHADPALFRAQVFALCRTRRSDASALADARQLVLALGATPLEIDAASHDLAVAQVSHLPYLLAASLVCSSHGQPADAMRLAASGYRDVSRLAASDPQMMVDVLLTNRQPVLESLGRARAELEQLTQLLDQREEQALHDYLVAAQDSRIAWWRARNPSASAQPAPSGPPTANGAS